MSLTERDIIRRYFDVPELALPRPEIKLGCGDDAAILDIPHDKQLLVSADVLVAGVHFPEHAGADLIASRALAVNLSDLAAMAAEPLCFTLSLTLPQADAGWLAEFSRGLARVAGEFRCPLIGGDLSRGPLQIAIQAHGLCRAGCEVRREGARPGQNVYLTGWVGDGALGLVSVGVATPGIELNAAPEKLPERCRAHFHDAFFQPVPRTRFALAAATMLASAIDVSDGLLGDAGHLAEAGNAGIVLYPERFPFSAAARCCATEESRIRAALIGGDDYELCFSADPANEIQLMEIAAGMDLPLTCVGEVVAGAGVTCAGMETNLTAFDHFQQGHN